MKLNASGLPVQIDMGGVVIRAINWGELNVARIQFPAGADATPLLQGMPGDLCPCPHWGLVTKGSIHVTYADGSEEVVRAGEAYYWPGGHTVRVDEPYEAIEFSPAEEMTAVVEHLASKMGYRAPPPTSSPGGFDEAATRPEATH